MEDAATAEISRAQIWQWIHQDAQFAGRPPKIDVAICRPHHRRGTCQGERTSRGCSAVCGLAKIGAADARFDPLAAQFVEFLNRARRSQKILSEGN